MRNCPSGWRPQTLASGTDRQGSMENVDSGGTLELAWVDECSTPGFQWWLCHVLAGKI